MLSDAAHQLEEGAQIKDFISVLAVKEVKGLLRAYRPTSPRHEQRNLNHLQPSQSSRVREKQRPLMESRRNSLGQGRPPREVFAVNRAGTCGDITRLEARAPQIHRRAYRHSGPRTTSFIPFQLQVRMLTW